MSRADWGVAFAALIALVIVLGFLLFRRASDIRRTRWGFFVERDRYQDDEPPTSDETQEWPQRKDDLN